MDERGVDLSSNLEPKKSIRVDLTPGNPAPEVALKPNQLTCSLRLRLVCVTFSLPQPAEFESDTDGGPKEKLSVSAKSSLQVLLSVSNSRDQVLSLAIRKAVEINEIGGVCGWQAHD